MVTAPGEASIGGDLGVATTPGTGFGIVCANMSARALDACRELGESLACAYEGTALPCGLLGQLDFVIDTS